MTVTDYKGCRRYLFANADNDPGRSDDDDRHKGDDPDTDRRRGDGDGRTDAHGDGRTDAHGDGKTDARSGANKAAQDTEGTKEEEEEEEGGTGQAVGGRQKKARPGQDGFRKRVVVRKRRSGKTGERPGAGDQRPEETPEDVDNKEDDHHLHHNPDPSLSSDSESYDTDLDPDTAVTHMFQSLKQNDGWSEEEDEEEEEEKGERGPAVDLVRRKEYLEACRALRAVPQTAILRHLHLSDLDLRHRNVGVANLKPLFVALKNNMRVQRLLLDENGVDGEGAESLALGLLDNVTVSYLVTVSLSDNPLGRRGVAAVVRLLLTSITIQGINLSSQ
ncbi:uncharacterized protein LOC143297629 [Babylonia areolata]|uniref:uncharacterized protein LOC143297629 n=1 Tax=Babylonia areolata TaxID=304850 RepID=UPI003FD20CC9